MRFKRAIHLLSCLAAVVLLLGCLALWIYLPATSGRSSAQIAAALLDYRNVTATNGLGALGTELPSSLMLYKDWNPSHSSGPDFAETYYYYYRLGIYFERSLTLKRDLPGGNTWTLTSTVRACPPGIQREFWWTQQLITITDGPCMLPPYDGKRNTIPSDVEIGKNLPGTWHITEWASENGWKEKVDITTNGDYSEVCVGGVGVEGSKCSGRVQINNGFLAMTVTNVASNVISFATKLPYTTQQRILYANAQRILISADPLPGKMLLEKELK